MHQQSPSLRAFAGIVITGAQTWFLGAGYAWMSMDDPSTWVGWAQCVPLVVLVVTVGTWMRRPGNGSEIAPSALAHGLAFPTALVASIAVRDETFNETMLPTWALLACTLFLWLHLALVSAFANGHADMTPDLARAWRKHRGNIGIVGGALAIAVVAPRLLEANVRRDAWREAWQEGALVTQAGAISLALALLTMGLVDSKQETQGRRTLLAAVPPLLVGLAALGGYLWLRGMLTP